ncbi:MAG: pentapeptide repeat-containing protein, partial [Methylocella sp.]
MNADAEEPEGKAGEPKPPKTKAEDNPWYLLATLYGVPEPKNLKLFEKNRGVWNHCLASFLDEHERDTLIKAERYTEAELEPIFPISWETELREALARRVTNEAQAGGLEARFASANKTVPEIDFSNTEFDRDISINGYLFSVRVLFKKTKFSEFAGFQNTTFFNDAQFNGASFQAAHFDNAHFWGASFQAATFAKGAVFTKATFSAPGALKWSRVAGPLYIWSNAYFGEGRETPHSGDGARVSRCPSCLVPHCGGVCYGQRQRGGLWAKFYPAAPARQRLCADKLAEQY